MTVEVALLNKEAVALAADSAVTFRDHKGEKIFQSANKIFTLSKYHPVGIMIYGSSVFMEIPWETVIKVYRRRLAAVSFSSISEYAEDFLKFLRREPLLNQAGTQRDYVLREVAVAFVSIREEIDEAVDALIKARDKASRPEIRRLAKNIISAHRMEWRKLPKPGDFPDEVTERLRDQYQEDFVALREKLFGQLLTPQAADWALEIATNVVIKMAPEKAMLGASGVVIAGFGDRDVYPGFVSLQIDAVVEGHLKYTREGSASIDHELPAIVRSFAQADTVFMFMEGIDPGYRELVETFTFKVLAGYPDELLKHLSFPSDSEREDLRRTLRRVAVNLFNRYSKELQEHRAENYAQPVVRVMSMLPKEELAAAAEALVNVTVLKRRFSPQSETVGGPTDVAVISKGDGFIWINRKHYFEPGLNHHFFANYFWEENDGGEGS